MKREEVPVLPTCFGPVRLTIDGRPRRLLPEPLPLQGRQFQVDARYQLTAALPLERSGITAVELRLCGDAPRALLRNVETGERLALVSFSQGSTKLSLGTVGDLPGVRYSYLEDGMRLEVAAQAALSALVFIAAWRTMDEPAQEALSTWFAADPGLG